jgi:cell filamentation protein
MAADRYAAGSGQTEAEPGSRGRVLRNLLGIKRVREMDQLESSALLSATEKLIDQVTMDQRFDAAFICRAHQLWLGGIYPWAGQYRQLQLSKDGFHFADAGRLKWLMSEFERKVLRRYTPCRSNVIQEQTQALAVVHAELVLIHPFREGNGRCARLLSTLMALQADLPPLDFSVIRGGMKHRYIAAIHAALDRNYAPMNLIFEKVIDRSLRSYGREESVS